MHRRWFTPVAGAVVAVLLLVTAAPASASGTDPATWAKEFCTAVGNWQHDLQRASTAIEGAAPNSVPAAKKALVNFLGKAVTLTKQAIAKAKKAGVPDVTDGKKVQQTLVGGLQKASSLFTKAQSQARSLPTDNPTKFASSAQEIGTALQKSGTALSTSLSKVSTLDTDQKLGTAISSEPSCANIG